jgi:uncharacterized lipoprotein
MKLKTTAACLALLGLAACSSNEVLRAPLDISVGQQLIELKQAHNNGAMSAEEYEQQRKQLIRNVR